MNEFRSQRGRRYERRMARGRREVLVTAELPVGAGSGGETVYGNQSVYFKGLWGVGAGQIKLYAESATNSGTSLSQDCPKMYLMSTDGAGSGELYMRGVNLTRITSGGGAGQPTVDDPRGYDGVQIQTADAHRIELVRGVTDSADKITLRPGKIWVTSSVGEIVVLAYTNLVLQCGDSSIMMDPTSIKISSHQVDIN